MDRDRERNLRGVLPPGRARKMSRRTMVAGTVATTAVAAVLPLSSSAQAQAPDPKSSTDMMSFVLLSAALTGVDRQVLAPEFSCGSATDALNADPGKDPIGIKDFYFGWINRHVAPGSFAQLLQIAKDNRQSQVNIIARVNSSDDTKYLARSIVLLWYLGSWYAPDDLKRFATAAVPISGAIPSQVASADAYTQGLAWRVVNAHPMGYSNLQFGHWSRNPTDPNPLPTSNPPKC